MHATYRIGTDRGGDRTDHRRTSGDKTNLSSFIANGYRLKHMCQLVNVGGCQRVQRVSYCVRKCQRMIEDDIGCLGCQRKFGDIWRCQNMLKDFRECQRLARIDVSIICNWADKQDCRCGLQCVTGYLNISLYLDMMIRTLQLQQYKMCLTQQLWQSSELHSVV